MYNILVVDDEPTHRRVLSSMLETLRPLYKISQAKNGREAVDFIEKQAVDILITDIRMPVMNGLKLVETCSEQLKDSRVVFITGYGEFEYARKAVKLGACDYILKPFDMGQINNLIEALEKSLLEARTAAHEKESLNRQMETIYPAYLEHQLNLWLSESLSSIQLDEVRSRFEGIKCGLLIGTKILNFSALIEKYSPEDLVRIKGNIIRLINTRFEVLGRCLSFFHSNKPELVLTLLCPKTSFSGISSQIMQTSPDFISEMKIKCEIELVVGISSVFPDIFMNARESFRHLQQALDQRFYHEDLEITAYRESFNEDDHSGIYPLKLEEQLKEAITRGDREAARKCIYNVLNKIRSEDRTPPGLFIESVGMLLANISRQVEYFIDAGEYKKLVNEMFAGLKRSKSFSMAEGITQDFILKIFNYLDEVKNKSEMVIMKQCLNYIELHYMEDLSLESLSDRFHFNASYFSRYFQIHTGRNFCDYITGLRLDKAKELLRNSPEKLNTIALLSGYKNIRYFSRVFKKITGMTPYDYRKMYCNDSI